MQCYLEKHQAYIQEARESPSEFALLSRGRTPQFCHERLSAVYCNRDAGAIFSFAVLKILAARLQAGFKPKYRGILSKQTTGPFLLVVLPAVQTHRV